MFGAKSPQIPTTIEIKTRVTSEAPSSPSQRTRGEEMEAPHAGSRRQPRINVSLSLLFASDMIIGACRSVGEGAAADFKTRSIRVLPTEGSEISSHFYSVHSEDGAHTVKAQLQLFAEGYVPSIHNVELGLDGRYYKIQPVFRRGSVLIDGSDDRHANAVINPFTLRPHWNKS